MVGRMVAGVRPEVSRALHGGRSCRDSAVISPGRRGRCTPTRNFEAKKHRNKNCPKFKLFLAADSALSDRFTITEEPEFAIGAAAPR